MTEDEVKWKKQEEERNNLDAAQGILTALDLVLPVWLVVVAILWAYFSK